MKNSYAGKILGFMAATGFVATGFVAFSAGILALNSEAVALETSEITLPSVGHTGIAGWKEVMKLQPGSAVKIEAFTSENNYIQPWVIYAWRAYEEQPAGMYIMPIANQHSHSSAVKWEILSNGTIQIRATKYNTRRSLKITELSVLRGNVDVYIK